MNTNAKNADRWLWLTIPITLLLAIAAGGGLFIGGLYRDTPGLVAQAIGQDAITLMIVFQAQKGEPAVISQVVIFITLFSVSIGMLVGHLKNLKS